jgi:hypothetical protein
MPAGDREGFRLSCQDREGFRLSCQDREGFRLSCQDREGFRLSCHLGKLAVQRGSNGYYATYTHRAYRDLRLLYSVYYV